LILLKYLVSLQFGTICVHLSNQLKKRDAAIGSENS